MRRQTLIATFLIAGLSVIAADMFFAPSAEAVPAFARKLNKPCSGCHSAWPLLNATGRKFRENGYRLSRKDKPESIINEFLKWDESLPVSAVVVSRPYDEKSSGDRKNRALHEVEMMVSGTVAEDMSLFFEFEAEDEDNFELKVAEGKLGYHPTEWLNFVLGWGEVFVADPYDTLSGARRLTRGRNSVIDQKFGSADNGGRLRSSRQSIQVYGRPVKQVFYNLGYSGVSDETEAPKASNFNARLAVDVIPELMIGAFGFGGECPFEASNCSTERDFSRWGIDVQADYRNFRLMAAYINAEDDRASGVGEDENTAWYVTGSYIYMRDKRPLLVPMVRFDQYEKSNGADVFSELTLNLTYYLKENVKIFAEYWDQLDVPAGSTEDNRITLQIAVGF